MAKLTNPIRFSDEFGIEEADLEARGVLNPTLSIDTRLFIDPLLLPNSEHVEMREHARLAYAEHFSTVVKLLRGSGATGDAPWRAALKHLSFPEVKGTCLGYGAESVSGAGSGKDTTAHIIETAKQIIDLGINDPDLFIAMSLFEDGFGPDRISDMTTNVIMEHLLTFNERVLTGLDVPREEIVLRLKNGNTYKAGLPINPYVRQRTPIILVPRDILRDLPIAKDWSEIGDAAKHNEELRERVNQDIADLWKVKTLKDKEEIKRWALSGKNSFETLMDMIRGVAPTPYDLHGDPLGEVFWQAIAADISKKVPFTLTRPAALDIDGVANVTEQIIEQFKFLIEQRRLSEDLYAGSKPRPEKAAQRLFFAVAYAYCKANNIDITPEADTGNGPVDFKLSAGFTGRVLVEIKLSANGKLVKGYTRQLEAYKQAEETVRGYYLVLDVGRMGEKYRRLQWEKAEAAKRGEQSSPIIYVDAIRRASASKL